MENDIKESDLLAYFESIYIISLCFVEFTQKGEILWQMGLDSPSRMCRTAYRTKDN
jgi:hypothetical protein